MEAVGEAFQLGLGVRLDQLQLVADDACERRGLALGLPIKSRDTWSGLLSSRCATPISTTSTSGTSCGCTCSGGSFAPLLMEGVAPFVACKSVSVSRATSVWPGALTKLLKSAAPRRGALPTSLGSVTGSMPSSRTERPLIWTRPSSTGETGQPARRSLTKTLAGRSPHSARPASPCARRQMSPPRDHRRCGPAD